MKPFFMSIASDSSNGQSITNYPVSGEIMTNPISVNPNGQIQNDYVWHWQWVAQGFTVAPIVTLQISLDNQSWDDVELATDIPIDGSFSFYDRYFPCLYMRAKILGVDGIISNVFIGKLDG